jgi:hypothetical protein
LFGASFAVGTSDQKRGSPVCLQLGQVPHVTSSVQWSRPAYHTPISARLNCFLFFPSGFKWGFLLVGFCVVFIAEHGGWKML